jgi:hypothetical protein
MKHSRLSRNRQLRSKFQSHQIGLLLTLVLASCSQKVAQVSEIAASPTMTLPAPSPLLIPSPTASPIANRQTYREKTGLFEISFPKGYTHKVTTSGIAFVSADQGFAGAVDYGSAEGKQLSTQQLEASLKAAFSQRLKQVNWQTSKMQADGSLRLDWTGKDKNGAALDAVSIVEQRGNSIFVLSLFGINKPYQNYNSDAEAIVNSYQIQPTAQPNSVQPSSAANNPDQANQKKTK